MATSEALCVLHCAVYVASMPVYVLTHVCAVASVVQALDSFPPIAVISLLLVAWVAASEVLRFEIRIDVASRANTRELERELRKRTNILQYCFALYNTIMESESTKLELVSFLMLLAYLGCVMHTYALVLLFTFTPILLNVWNRFVTKKILRAALPAN
jgi:hypothetical protein